MSDVRVMGLVMGTHVLEDIGMDVPFGAVVTIPADRASRSRDLHRAISSKQVRCLPSAAHTNPMQPAATGPASDARIQMLEQECFRLRAELDTANTVHDAKLDAILAALRNGVPVMAGAPVRGIKPPTEQLEVANGDAPVFIPSDVRAEGEARIDTKTSETASSSVSDAADRLRRLRAGQ